jgi:hypothetical protein
VSLVDASGAQLGQPAQRDPGTTPIVATLHGGDSAYALIGFPNPDNFPAGKCTAESANMRVYPPDETEALLLPAHHAYCPGFIVRAFTAEAPQG